MSNTDTMKEFYLLAQEHCGLKVGDWVRVIRRAESREAGWNNPWVSDMDAAVGAVGRVEGFSCFGVSVYFPKPIINTWNFPYFVLGKTQKPAHEFKPFDRVLVRMASFTNTKWSCNFFSNLIHTADGATLYLCLCGTWDMCIPYEGNEHLVGTTDKPEE